MSILLLNSLKFYNYDISPPLFSWFRPNNFPSQGKQKSLKATILGIQDQVNLATDTTVTLYTDSIALFTNPYSPFNSHFDFLPIDQCPFLLGPNLKTCSLPPLSQIFPRIVLSFSFLLTVVLGSGIVVITVCHHLKF